jgi:hypothetical protein
MKWLLATFLTVMSLATLAPAHAGEAEDQIFSLTSVIKSRYLADSGDLKLAVLDVESRVGEAFGNSSKCTKRRAGDLSRAFRGVLEATTGTNAHAIYEAAKVLHFSAHQRSAMYTRCWNHMTGQAKALGEVVNIGIQVIAIGAGAGW